MPEIAGVNLGISGDQQTQGEEDDKKFFHRQWMVSSSLKPLVRLHVYYS
jgi:hypothetical protein